MSVTLREAFKHQIETTRLIIQEDLNEDEDGDSGPVLWNGVFIQPDGNFYSSGKEMKAGDKLLIAYVVSVTETPSPAMIEESEIDFYENKFVVVRVVDNIPVVQVK